MKENNKINLIKESKPLVKGDIFIYLFVILVTVLLFIIFVIDVTPTKLEGVVIEKSGQFNSEEILYYDFAKDNFNINHKYNENIEIKTEHNKNSYFVAIKIEEEYNVIVIEKSGKVYVSDANCSFKKDCTHFKGIVKGGDSIICLPHKLIITGISEGAELPIVIG